MGLINAINCDKLNLGLGIVSCEQQLGEFAVPILIRKGWSMDVTDFQALDQEGFMALIQSGVWQPIPGYTEFINNTPETTTQEYSGGQIRAVRNGKAQYQWNYDMSYAFHKALYSKNSNSAWDIGIITANNVLLLAGAANGTRVKGITAGMVNTGTYTPRVGDTNAITPFMVQLTNEDEFNTRLITYNSDVAEVDFLSFRPIISATITGTASAANGITVQVNAVNNTSYGVQGLVAANFRVINNTTNAVITIATVVESTVVPGQYKITTTPSLTNGTTVRVELYDASVPAPVAVDALGSLYQAVSAAITAAAVIIAIFSMQFNSIFG